MGGVERSRGNSRSNYLYFNSNPFLLRPAKFNERFVVNVQRCACRQQLPFVTLNGLSWYISHVYHVIPILWVSRDTNPMSITWYISYDLYEYHVIPILWVSRDTYPVWVSRDPYCIWVSRDIYPMGITWYLFYEYHVTPILWVYSTLVLPFGTNPNNRVHQNVSLHISFLIFYGSLIGCIILLPQEVVLWLVTKIVKYYFRRK